MVSAGLNRPRLRWSVRAKIISVVLLTATLALLFAGIAMLTHDVAVYREAWISDMRTQAGIVSRATAPALAFDDRESALHNLAALAARTDVHAAALYTLDGARYALWTRAGQAPPPARAPAALAATRIRGERLDVWLPVQNNGELLGHIYLRATYDVHDRIAAYVGILGVVMLAGIGVALVSSAALSRVITDPLDSMAAVAREVVGRRDYALRARKTSDDEIGVVVDAFNSMLDEVQQRTRALEQSESALRESERLYRAIGESLDYGVWICDEQGRNVYVSESFLRLVGLTQEECADHGWFALLHPDDVATTLAAWQDCVRGDCAWYREHRVRGVDGQYHPVLALGVPVHDERGRVTGWAGINLDISRLKRTEEALREADRRKDEFLATLAHELRNPLAPIRHAVRLLENPAVDPPRHEWARAVIARQVHRMALLLDDLLDVSRITRGRLSLKKSRVRLDALVESALETARPLIEARRQHLEVMLDDPARVLDVDALRVSQALSNLLTNAAKYTDDEGRIALVVRREGDELLIAVADTGIGLAPEALSKVFEIFTQIGSAIDRAEGGLGIGLALVRGLVALHGGSVEARSAGLGLGSEFRIRLPASCIVAVGIETAAAIRRLPAAEPGSCSVLVADDNRDAADTLAMVLESFGHRVSVAYSGEEAIASARRERPGVVVLDIGMPDLTGYEVAGVLRAEPGGESVLLLAVTGWGQDVDRRRALDAGFDRHLTKPVDAPQVQQAIEEHLARRRDPHAPGPPAAAATGA